MYSRVALELHAVESNCEHWVPLLPTPSLHVAKLTTSPSSKAGIDVGPRNAARDILLSLAFAQSSTSERLAITTLSTQNTYEAAPFGRAENGLLCSPKHRPR